MQEIRQWAFGICSAAIACGLMQLILPKSGIQRIFSVVISVFFLSSLISPILFSFQAPLVDLSEQDKLERRIEQNSQNLSEAVEEHGKQIASESVRLEAGKTLDDMGIEYKKIYVNIHTEDSGDISISECEIELDESYLPRHKEIRAELMDKLGVDVKIGYEKG